MDDEHSKLQAFILHLLERAKLGVPFLFFVPLFFPTYYKRSWINTGPAVSFFGLGVFVYVWKPWSNSRA
jgi:glycopeptide antibiotics resistance protein